MGLFAVLYEKSSWDKSQKAEKRPQNKAAEVEISWLKIAGTKSRNVTGKEYFEENYFFPNILGKTKDVLLLFG